MYSKFIQIWPNKNEEEKIRDESRSILQSLELNNDSLISEPCHSVFVDGGVESYQFEHEVKVLELQDKFSLLNKSSEELENGKSEKDKLEVKFHFKYLHFI